LLPVRRGGRTLGTARLLKGLTVDRGRPDLVSLEAETDPDAFVWGILPHAARSFAASIVVLPEGEARAAAVAYLYCRMLDTYEDLLPDTECSVAEMKRFADRLKLPVTEAAREIPPEMARDDRDRVYLLLIRRSSLVDQVFNSLDAETRQQIIELIDAMAEGMAWSREAFEKQGGVLLDQVQLAAYCRNVIGYPALFTLAQVSDLELPDSAREDALLVSEMIQLANVTRDVERDLERGVGYHPDLKPFLGQSTDDAEVMDAVREARETYMAMALSRVPAYRRLFEGMRLGGSAPVRVAAVLMILFTELHYRGCAVRTGNQIWRGPRSRLDVVLRSLPAAASPSWAIHTIRRVEREFLASLQVLPTNPPKPRPAIRT
jgi:phytoene/squalene synthetase